jgi:hypothetical protein
VVLHDGRAAVAETYIGLRDLREVPWKEFSEAEKKIAEAKMVRLVTVINQLNRMGFNIFDVDHHDGTHEQILAKSLDKDAPFFTRSNGGRWKFRNNSASRAN